MQEHGFQDEQRNDGIFDVPFLSHEDAAHRLDRGKLGIELRIDHRSRVQ